MARTRQSVLDLFKKGGHGAEIGVFMGGFSRRIIKHAKPKKLYMIDPWKNMDDPGLDKAWYKAGSDFDMEAIHDEVVTAFAKRAARGQVEILRGTTADRIGDIPDDSLDYVYIDGDHRYEGVRLDLMLSLPKVKTGGLIAVDDHVQGYWWKDGVVRAVNETLGDHAGSLQIIACHENQVVLRRTQEVDPPIKAGRARKKTAPKKVPA